MRASLVALALGGVVAVSTLGVAAPASAQTVIQVQADHDWRYDRWRHRHYYRPYYYRPRPPVVYYPPPPPPAYYYPPPRPGFSLYFRG